MLKFTRLLPDLWRQFCVMLGNQPTLRHYLQPVLQTLIPAYHVELFRAKLVSKAWQTPDMLRLRLKVSSGWKGFTPGQHILLTLQYQGRYITRPFSLSSPLQLWQSKQEIHLTCQVKDEGELTPILASLETEVWLNISAAQGNFVRYNEAQGAVFFAAGSGITPIYSMLCSQQNWQAPVTLYYRYRGEKGGAYLMELRKLADTQPLFTLRLSDSTIEPWENQNLADITQTTHYPFMLCGPHGFMYLVRQQLNNMGVPDEAILQEQFGLVLPGSSEDSDPGTVLSARFIHQELSREITISSSMTLLQSAEKQGLTPTFGCRVGVCYQCVCNKISGQVRDLRSGQLSAKGREQIQLCISQPVSDLIIEY